MSPLRFLLLATGSAAALLLLMVPAWAGLAGLWWADAYDDELSLAALCGIPLFFASAVGYFAWVVVPNTSGNKPDRLSLRDHLVPTLLVTTVVLGVVTGTAEFVVDMISGTAAEQYRTQIVSAMYGAVVLGILVMVFFQRPYWLLPDTLKRIRDARDERRVETA